MTTEASSKNSSCPGLFLNHHCTENRNAAGVDFRHQYIFFAASIKTLSGQNHKSSSEPLQPVPTFSFSPPAPPAPPVRLLAPSQASLIPLWFRRRRPPLNSIITAGTGWQFSLPCCNPLFNKSSRGGWDCWGEVGWHWHHQSRHWMCPPPHSERAPQTHPHTPAG